MAVIAPTVWRVGTPLLVRGRRWRVDAVTIADESVGLAAAIVYALAFSVELAVSLVEYFGQEAQA